MNEVELIRTRLRREATHAGEVAALWARAAPSAPPDLRQACVDYLAWVLTRFEDRDQKLTERLRGWPAQRSQTMLEALGRPGTSRAALVALERALAGGSGAAAVKAATEFAREVELNWQPRRHAIDAVLVAGASVADWRAIADIDADAILEERERHARIAQFAGPAAAQTR